MLTQKAKQSGTLMGTVKGFLSFGAKGIWWGNTLTRSRAYFKITKDASVLSISYKRLQLRIWKTWLNTFFLISASEGVFNWYVRENTSVFRYSWAWSMFCKVRHSAGRGRTMIFCYCFVLLFGFAFHCLNLFQNKKLCYFRSWTAV